MGGKSTGTSSTQQQTTPWDVAGPQIKSLVGQLGTIQPGLTGTETGALNTLTNNAQAGNPYAPAIGSLATDLLSGGPDRTGMVSDAYSQYKTGLDSTARGDYLDPTKNSSLQAFLSQAGNDAAGQVNSLFASAGRDFSGAHAKALGKGVAAAQSPILYDAYNRARTDQLGAIDKLYGAGGATAGLLSGLDQASLGNRQAGISAAESALGANDSAANRLLSIEAQKRGIPQQNITSLLSTLGPLAAQFGQTNSNTQTTQNKSLTDQITQFMTAWGAMTGAGKQQGAQPFAWG